jgi:MFS family permease
MHDMVNKAALYYAVDAVAALVTGWVTDFCIRLGLAVSPVRKSAMAVGLMTAAVGFLGCAWATAHSYFPWLMVAAVGLGSGGAGLFTFTQTLAGPRAVGRWCGLQNGFGNLFPLPFRLGTGAIWIGQRFAELFSDATLLRYRCPIVFALVAATGIVVVWKRSRLTAWLLCGPAIVALAAAIAQQYPFRGRLALWLLPAAVLALAAGADWIRAQASALHPAVGVLVVLALSIAPVMALAEAPPPYEIEHHLEVLGYLKQHRQPGDVIYVMQLGEVGTQFYGPRFGLQPNEWITGACDRDDSRVFLRDVDRFRLTPRLWVVAGSGRPLMAVRAAVLKYLRTIGIRRDAKVFPSMLYGSITIELYDLTDPAHLADASSENFPVPPMPRDPKIGCRDWTKPDYDWNFLR